MHTSIKEKAITSLKEGFYPKHVVAEFLSYPQHKRARNWVNDINSVGGLKRYIWCQDAKFYGHKEKAEKDKRKFYGVCGVTVKRMADFIHLNYLFLLDEYDKTTNEHLKKYYKALVCLNGGQYNTTYIVMERKKMQESVHRLQAKLIKELVANPPQKEVLKNFIILSVLFSLGDLLHEETIRKDLIKLCQLATE